MVVIASEAPLPTILQNWRKSLRFHVSLPKGLSIFDGWFWICHTQNYVNVQNLDDAANGSKTPLKDNKNLSKYFDNLLQNKPNQNNQLRISNALVWPFFNECFWSISSSYILWYCILISNLLEIKYEYVKRTACMIYNVLCYLLTGIEDLHTALGHIMSKICSHCWCNFAKKSKLSANCEECEWW